MGRILDYTGDDLASAKALPDGVMLTRVTENPLLSPASVSSPAVWITLALPDLIWFSPDHERNLSRKNLEAIGDAIKVYSTRTRKYPADLQTLVDEKILDAQVLTSPFGDGAGPTDYTYLMIDPKLGKNTILVYDAAEQRIGKGATVLYTNFQLDFLDKPTFDKTLREAKIPPKSE